MSNVLAGLPDTHDDQTPPEVLRRNAVLAAALAAAPESEAAPEEDAEESTADDGPPGAPQFVGAPEPAPELKPVVARATKPVGPQDQLQQLLSNKALEKIAIEITLPVGSFEMEFQVAGVCVNTDSIAFFIPKQVGKFKLPANPAQEIKVTHHSKIYQVIYVGGFFTFPNLDYSLLSFLIVDDEPKS